MYLHSMLYVIMGVMQGLTRGKMIVNKTLALTPWFQHSSNSATSHPRITLAFCLTMGRTRTATELAHRVRRHSRITSTLELDAAKPWRFRRKRVHRTLLPTEKRARREKLVKDREEQDTFLKTCFDLIWGQALIAHARWPQHSPEYHYQTIMASSRKPVNTRAANMWNAYSRQELKKINDGECLYPLTTSSPAHA